MKAYLKLLLSYGLMFILLPFRLYPIKKNRLLFIAIEGGGKNKYSCNPMYITEYLLQHYKEDFEICWLVESEKEYSFLMDKGISIAKHFTLKSFFYCLTSAFVITNGGYVSWFPFRKDQYIINSWHGGGAYKKLETDRKDSNWATKKRMEFCGNNISLFLSSCALFTKYVIRGVFKYSGEVLEAGLPRNDFLLCNEANHISEKVKNFYGLSFDTKLVLYAPTFREYSLDKKEMLDINRVLTALQERFSGSWTFLYRGHSSALEDFMANSNLNEANFINVSDYPDMQELLYTCDVLITDYSSSIWDYSLTYKPGFLFIPDIDKYVDMVDFYVDINQWPYPKAKDNIQLINEIKSFDQDQLNNDINKHHSALGSYESGRSTVLLMDKILSLYHKKTSK